MDILYHFQTLKMSRTSQGSRKKSSCLDGRAIKEKELFLNFYFYFVAMFQRPLSYFLIALPLRKEFFCGYPIITYSLFLYVAAITTNAF